MAMIKNVIAQLNMVILLTLLFRGACPGASITPSLCNQVLENPAFLTRHLVHRLSLVDVHHSQGGAVSHTAAGSAELGLGRVLKRHAWRSLLLVLFPAQELLADDQSDQQRKYAKQALLEMQWRDT
jgi:hypothetical protein